MPPGVGVFVLRRGHISHTVKMHYSVKNPFLNSEACFRQAKCIEMMSKEGSTKIVHFMIPMAEVLELSRDHLSLTVKMLYFLKNLPLYTQA